MFNKTGFLVKLLIALLLLFGQSFVGIVQAHGGGGTPQLSDAEAGVYRIYVWTEPDPIQIGEMHVTVAVFQQSETENGKIEENPVFGADVQIEIGQTDSAGGKLTAIATHENSTNKLQYVAVLKPPSAGKWQVTVTVKSPSGSGVAEFEVEVVSGSGFNWSLAGGLGLVVLLVGGFAVQRFSGQKKSL